MTTEEFAAALRTYWSFDERQQHTNSWHSREDFIEKVLPDLLDDFAQERIFGSGSLTHYRIFDYLKEQCS